MTKFLNAHSAETQLKIFTIAWRKTCRMYKNVYGTALLGILKTYSFHLNTRGFFQSNDAIAICTAKKEKENWKGFGGKVIHTVYTV